MNEGNNQTKPTFWQVGYRLLVNTLGWAITFLIIFTLISAAAYLVKEGGKDDKAPLTRGDFQPLLEAVHNSWTKVPGNRITAPEIKVFDRFSSKLQEDLAAIDWSRGLEPKAAEQLEAGTKSVREAATRLTLLLSKQDAELLKAMSSVQVEVRKLTGRIDSARPKQWAQRVVEAYSEGIKALGKMVTTLIGWPLVTIIGIAFLLAYADKMGGISNLFGGVKSIKIAGGSEIVFSTSQADELSKTANEVFDSYRAKATEEFAALAMAEDISTRVKNVAEKRILPYLQKTIKQYLVNEQKIQDPKNPTEDEIKSLHTEVTKRWDSLRFTVYVEDLLFNKTICQFVDYFPEGDDTAGRAWSVRYGMVGRIWRLQQSHTETNVTTDEAELVTQWGMTRDEVRNFVSKKKTFTSVILKDNDRLVGLFYMDSDKENVFELPSGGVLQNELHIMVEEACEEFGLTRSLADVARRIKNRQLDIRIYG